MSNATRVTRREFLELSLRTAAAASLAGSGLAGEPPRDPAAASAATPVSELDAYNYAVRYLTVASP